MDYYDYTGAGLTADQEPTIALNNSTKIHNDGDFEICSTEEMAALGVNTTGKSAGTQWLTSEVSLQRGKIVPGIQKDCMVEQASTTDTIGWTVTGYNSGNGTLRDYTYTDIMMYPYQFTGMVSYQIYQKNAEKSASVKSTLFQIIDRDEQSVTIQYSTSYNSDRYAKDKTAVMQIDGDPVTINSYYFGEIDVSIGHDSNQNEILSVRFKDTKAGAIPANSKGTLTVYTNNVSSLNENKIFINQCYLTPNEQEFEGSEVSQGTYTTFDLPSDEDSERRPSVVSEAQVGVSYGYATRSVKTVTELTENGKSAASNSATNYIVLSNGEDSTFRYDLQVENNGGNSLPQDLNLLVLIDNLPEVGDHTTFYKEYARYSDFQVDFAEPEELNPVVTVKTADGKSKTLSSKQYTLQFSKQTDLNFANNTELWQGEEVGTKDGWYTLAELEANDLDLKDMRTFRVVIEDPELTGMMPAKSTISFGFNAVVHKDGEKVPSASQIAWNSFGYLYQIGTLKLQAAPLNVGVKIAGVPHLVKNLVDSQKKMYVTDEDENFRFLICKGSITQINSQSTETDKMKWLTDMEIPFTVAEITVPKGSSGSDAIPLDHMKVCTYDTETGEYKETEEDWIWADKAAYTVTELMQEGEDAKYTFGNINSNKLNQYIFTFDKSTSIHLTATNIRKEWDLQLLKTDSTEKKKLSGAIFGLYSKKQTDQLAEDTALPEKLNTQPEWSITKEDGTWYLMDIQTTDQDGQIRWSKLTDDEYYILELQAPMGYRLGKEPGQVVKWTVGTEVEQVNIVNASIFQLPHAGGMGTELFTISGLCLIAGGLLHMWLKRRRKRF
jgi:LPXTG-motif cell wall-anchored protein